MAKSLFSLFGKVGAGLVTALALFYAIENFRGARAWQAERHRLEAKGEELSWAKLMPPAASLDLPRRPEVVAWRSKEFLSVAGFRPEFAGSSLGSGPDGLIAIQNWRTMLLQPAAPTEAETLCAAGSSFLKATESLNPVIEALVEAARAGPIADWELKAGEPPDSTLLPPLLQMRRLSRVLRLRIAAHSSCGESQRAIAEMRVMARLQQSLEGLPFAITSLMEMALADEMLDTIHDGLARGQLGERHRREVAALLSDGWIESARLALRAERNWLVFYAESPESASVGRLTRLGLRLMPRGWLLRQAVHIARSTDDALQLLENPSRIDPSAIDGLAHGEREQTTPYNVIARMTELSVGRLARNAVALQTRVRLIRVAFALSALREKAGAYPQTLSALAPSYLAAVPTDIVNGQPLQYRPSNNGFSLYSVGWDLKDDGAPSGPHAGFAYRRDWALTIGSR